MKDKKNIDNRIREKLDDYRLTPPPHIWNNVQGQLSEIRRRKKLVYLGWISAAAVIVLAFMAGWYFNDSVDSEKNVSAKNEILHQEENKKENALQNQEVATLNEQSENFSSNENNQKSSGTSEVSYAATSSSANELASVKENIRLSETITFTMIKSADARVAQKNQPNTEMALNTRPVAEKKLTSHEQLLIAENIKNIKAAEKEENNWKMGMFVAPGYSSYSASHTESYAQKMSYSGNSGNANVSGGFSIQYKTNKRWIVESGIYYAQSGQESNNTVNIFALKQDAGNMFAPSPEGTYFNNNVRVENNKLAMNSTAGIIEFSAAPRGAEFSSEFEASKTAESSIMVPDGQFSQVFEFMEVPVFVRYRVVDSKFGIELITGLNAGIVVGNNAYIDNQYGLQNIGETKDISTVNLSGTVGVGLNYALGKHFSVAVEPRFNYYLNSINTNSAVDFRPYRIGFYSGVTYAF